MIHLHWGCAHDRRHEIAYALEALLRMAGVATWAWDAPATSASDLVIQYGAPQAAVPGGPFVINLAATDAELALRAMQVSELRPAQGDEGATALFAGEVAALPGLLYADAASGAPAITCSDDAIHVAPDILASAYYLLSCRQESEIAARDQWGRFNAAHSPLAEQGLLAAPLVDRYASLLRELLLLAAQKRHASLGLAPTWPGGRSFALCLTHDVDLIRKKTLGNLATTAWHSLVAARRGRWPLVRERATGIARLYLRRGDPYWSFPHILSVEEAHGVRSSFYFLAGDVNARGQRKYRLGDRRMRALLAELAQGGWEIGLHGGWRAWDDGPRIAREKAELERYSGQPATGIRQHYLRLAHPDTLRLQAEAGLDYDTSLGFADRVGYRAGTSLPFRPWDARQRRALPIWEIPLTVMDGSLKVYQRLDAEAAWASVRGLLEATERAGGCLTILWHNTYFQDEVDAPGFGAVYARILDWTREHNGWGCSAQQLCEWWQEQRPAQVEA